MCKMFCHQKHVIFLTIQIHLKMWKGQENRSLLKQTCFLHVLLTKYLVKDGRMQPNATQMLHLD